MGETGSDWKRINGTLTDLENKITWRDLVMLEDFEKLGDLETLGETWRVGETERIR